MFRSVSFWRTTFICWFNFVCLMGMSLGVDSQAWHVAFVILTFFLLPLLSIGQGMVWGIWKDYRNWKIFLGSHLFLSLIGVGFFPSRYIWFSFWEIMSFMIIGFILAQSVVGLIKLKQYLETELMKVSVSLETDETELEPVETDIVSTFHSS